MICFFELRKSPKCMITLRCLLSNLLNHIFQMHLLIHVMGVLWVQWDKGHFVENANNICIFELCKKIVLSLFLKEKIFEFSVSNANIWFIKDVLSKSLEKKKEINVQNVQHLFFSDISTGLSARNLLELIQRCVQRNLRLRRKLVFLRNRLLNKL